MHSARTRGTRGTSEQLHRRQMAGSTCSHALTIGHHYRRATARQIGATKMAARTKSATKSGGTKSTRKQTAGKSGTTAKRAKTSATKKTAAAKSAPVFRNVKLTSADGKTRTVRRPVESHQFGRLGTVRRPEFQAAAEIASKLACTDANGQPIGRARIGTEQIALVAAYVKRQRQPVGSVVHALIGGKSAKQSATTMRAYADQQIGQTELPDGARERLSAAAGKLDAKRTPKQHKMNGRALAAAFVGLVEAK